MLCSSAITFVVLITAKFVYSEIVSDVVVGRLQPRITNGLVANQAEFPYMAAIEVADVSSCGASIIQADVVLTAAHCTSKYTNIPRLLKVRAGTAIMEDNKGQNVQWRWVKRIVNHPKYNISAYNDNDIAIVQLRTPFALNKFVNIVKLAEISYTGHNGIVIGWGKDQNFRDVRLLKKGIVQIISNDQCAQKSISGYKITSNMVCAIGKAQKQTICKGDSGGPIIIHDAKNPKNDVLVGVTSYGHIINARGTRFCDPSHPAVFTSVEKKLEWILKEL